jgi:ABC-type multidrug transport system fused ATPase/permease subunit
LVIDTAGALAGGVTAGILVAGFVFLFAMSWKMNALKHEVSQIQDKQASLFCEVLANIRSFRFYGWDAFFLDKLDRMTDALVPAQRKLVWMKAVNSALVIAFPVIPATVIFVISYYETGVGPTLQFQALVLSLLNTFRYATRFLIMFARHHPSIQLSVVEPSFQLACCVVRKQLLHATRGISVTIWTP